MAHVNYQFEKRRRDLEKKKKQEEKRQRKAERKKGQGAEPSPEAGEAATDRSVPPG